MPEFIDARGLGCAQPVLLARAALETHDKVIIDVDARMPVENITALARHTVHDRGTERPDCYSIK